MPKITQLLVSKNLMTPVHENTSAQKQIGPLFSVLLMLMATQLTVCFCVSFQM